jgi:hypothetical protein
MKTVTAPWRCFRGGSRRALRGRPDGASFARLAVNLIVARYERCGAARAVDNVAARVRASAAGIAKYQRLWHIAWRDKEKR